jgi:hypothetical protein
MRQQGRRATLIRAERRAWGSQKPRNNPPGLFPISPKAAHSETRGGSSNTLHGYSSKAARSKGSPLGGVEVSKLTTRDLDRRYDALLAGGSPPPP